MNNFERHTILIQVGGHPRPDTAGEALAMMDKLAGGAAEDESGRILKPGETLAAVRRAAGAHAQFRFRGSRHDEHPVYDFVQWAEEGGFSLRVVTTHRETGNQLRTALFIPQALRGDDFRAIWEGEGGMPTLDASSLARMLAAPEGAVQAQAWCLVAQQFVAPRSLPVLTLAEPVQAQAA